MGHIMTVALSVLVLVLKYQFIHNSIQIEFNSIQFMHHDILLFRDSFIQHDDTK